MMDEPNKKNEPNTEPLQGAEKKKGAAEPLLQKKQPKSSFFSGGKPSSKSYNSSHGFNSQKNHRVKHG